MKETEKKYFEKLIEEIHAIKDKILNGSDPDNSSWVESEFNSFASSGPRQSIRLPNWWPKFLDVNLWFDTKESRIKRLKYYCALAMIEIEGLEILAGMKHYQIWIATKKIPLLLGQTSALDFDSAVKKFYENADKDENGDIKGLGRKIRNAMPGDFSSIADWNNRPSNWVMEPKHSAGPIFLVDSKEKAELHARD